MPLVFIDFEASSLSAASYPIEIAWIREDGRGESHLIRPEPTWMEWDLAAEQLHRISWAELCEFGLPTAEVVRWLVADLGTTDCCLVSDEPETDGVWLGRLMRLVGQDPLPLLAFDALCADEVRRLIEALGQRRVATPPHAGARHSPRSAGSFRQRSCGRSRHPPRAAPRAPGRRRSPVAVATDAGAYSCLVTAGRHSGPGSATGAATVGGGAPKDKRQSREMCYTVRE